MADEWDRWYEEPYNNETFPINDVLFGDPSMVDLHAQELFVEAFFNDDSGAYIDLVNYMYDQYGIDFEEAFDWEDFREWYDG